MQTIDSELNHLKPPKKSSLTEYLNRLVEEYFFSWGGRRFLGTLLGSVH